MKAIKELDLGLTGIRKALGVLRDYYGGGASSALVQAADGQPAAPATHSKAGGAGESIINVLEVCESDFAKNLAETQTEEESRAEAYEQNTQENKIAKTSKEKDAEYKSKEATSLDKAISELSSDLDTENAELSAVNEYWEKLQARCVAKPETYEERKERRAAEIAGLKEALAILENEVALVQGSRRHRSRHVRGSL